jgi:hypothetical protein
VIVICGGPVVNHVNDDSPSQVKGLSYHNMVGLYFIPESLV